VSFAQDREKVLITGSNGLLGQKLCQHFSSSYQVIAFDLHPQSFVPLPDLSYESLDLTDGKRLGDSLRMHNPSVIINAAAYTDVDGCEIHKSQAWGINVGVVKSLVTWCREHDMKLIQLSTDYVFDGENGPYSEDDPPQPVSCYGETKLESEKLVEQSGIDGLIVRTNVLYGFGKKVKENFLIWLLKKLSAGEKVKVVTDQFNNPTLADNLSWCILEMAKRGLDGIFHVGGTEYLSRYDFALKAAEKFGFDRNLISPIRTELLEQKARRPRRAGLKTDKAQRILNTRLLSVEEGLEQARKTRPGIQD
jgi:dTDP-4-dehydrorhamnose reductase